MPDAAQLRAALAAHLGKTLTPEVAAAVFVAALEQPDESHNPEDFPPEAHGPYTFQVERFSAVVGELGPLHQAQWLETEKHRHGIGLDPDYPALLKRERAGGLLQFTVRRDGRLVGNLRMYLGRSTHSQTLFAEEDTLYLCPEERGGVMVLAFMRYAERALRQVGAREIRANSKLVNRADVLMRRMGYTPVATQFVKVFKE